MADNRLYDLMSSRSRKRFLRRRYGYGKELEYKPHSNLVKSLARATGLTKEAIAQQLRKERRELLSRRGR